MGIREKVERWSDIAVSNYVNNIKCMNKTIAGAAQKEGLNNEHIDSGLASKLSSRGYSDFCPCAYHDINLSYAGKEWSG
jgi:hypothetical protein